MMDLISEIAHSDFDEFKQAAYIVKNEDVGELDVHLSSKLGDDLLVKINIPANVDSMSINDWRYCIINQLESTLKGKQKGYYVYHVFLLRMKNKLESEILTKVVNKRNARLRQFNL